ncbi:MAG: glycosyltransferase family 2 protein [Deltaproteobacteria bacterium]|nr:glycosyltransferase family 2 protein [Deltaproteobacteria bacterium]
MASPETQSRHAISAHTVCAIVVSFFPDVAALRRLFAATLPQVDALVIADNGTSDAAFDGFCAHVESDKVVILKQCRNIGLAAAFNRGIAWARENGFSHVLLLDQDSEPVPGMVDALIQAFADSPARRRIAAVGPRFHDAREDRYAPFVRVGFPVNRKIFTPGKGGLVDCDFLISSGSLIPLVAIDDIGAMDEGLFIDNVDLEWSFRALAKGYALIGVCTTTMHHRLGQSRRRLPFGLGQFVVHDPIRLYYIMRNRLLLYHLPHTPAVWIVQDLPRVVFKFLLFTILVCPRRRNVRFMLTGLRDGLLGRSGPFVEPQSAP